MARRCAACSASSKTMPTATLWATLPVMKCCPRRTLDESMDWHGSAARACHDRACANDTGQEGAGGRSRSAARRQAAGAPAESSQLVRHGDGHIRTEAQCFGAAPRGQGRKQIAAMPDMSASTNPQLLSLRTQIDAVDSELLALLNRRAALAQRVGDVKKKEGSVAFRPEREAQVIDR